jgi:hypothetical protein
MQPWLNSEGRVIGAIERWQLARPAGMVRQRLDCVTLDFAATGIG